MKSTNHMNVIFACLLALSMTGCGQEPPAWESTAAYDEENSSTPESSKGEEPIEDLKDEPTLDWSAVETASEEDFEFSNASIGPANNAVKGVKIRKYVGEGGVVKIPDSYQGQPVILIDRDAFRESAVTDVCFETDGFVYIQGDAFRDCTSLNSIVIKGNAKTEIRDLAFDGCTSLTSVVLSEDITNFGINPFRNTAWLENKRQVNPLVIVNHTVLDGELCAGSVVIPEGTVRITAYAFFENAEITGVTLPDSIEYVDMHAFAACKSLTETNIPDNIVSIEGVFNGSENIVLTYQGKKYTYEMLKELISLIGVNRK